ncbi:MAG: arylsulfatase [Planctomycetota bacterium]|nr:MAG: arylsulfatase [Planctomycetota bacterium]
MFTPTNLRFGSTSSTMPFGRLPWAECLLALAGLLVATSVQAAKPSRPNVLIILADDLGFSDLGCYGSEIETPNLDKLAAEGLRFTQFYNTAKCHSSRVSILTGLYCMQAGDVELSRSATIAEVARDAGYFTLMAGKWHLKHEPTDRGFQRYFGHLSGATNYFIGDDTFRLNGEKFDDFDDDFYTTDANTDYAIRFIDEALAEGKPFLGYIAYNAPHYPLQAPKECVEKYRGRYDAGWDVIREARYRRQLDMGLFAKPWKLSPRPPEVPAWDLLTDEEKRWESDRMAVFAGMVDRLDQNIGRLIAHLKEKGVYENTFILFCSDNGACPFERTRGREYAPWDPRSYWTYDVGWAHVGNTPFRWYKQNQHEGGISSPCIISWPKGLKVPPGSITHQPAHLIDVMATVCELTGGTYPKQAAGHEVEPLQGLSLLPILQGQVRRGHDWLYFIFSNNRAIREGNWKLVSARGGPWELYDLSVDRTELNNLVDEKPELAKRLEKMWYDIAEKVDRAPERLRKPVKSEPQFFPPRPEVGRATADDAG